MSALRGKSARKDACELCGNRTLGRRACIRCEINNPEKVVALLADDEEDPMHPSTEAILRFFEYDHLPSHLAAESRPFHELAHDLAKRFEGAELTVALRKLLEAKDCAVRCALDPPVG